MPFIYGRNAPQRYCWPHDVEGGAFSIGIAGGMTRLETNVVALLRFIFGKRVDGYTR